LAKQTTPHTQTDQNINIEQDDLEPDQSSWATDPRDIDQNVAGAETGGTRSPKRIPDPLNHHDVEPAPAAYEGSVFTRTPKGSGQGITSHSVSEESARQEKVVKDRPDAEAGVNHSGKR